MDADVSPHVDGVATGPDVIAENGCNLGFIGAIEENLPFQEVACMDMQSETFTI
jgi:hypothetical protein